LLFLEQKEIKLDNIVINKINEYIYRYIEK
jgi:hypothetical protein